MVIYGKLLMEMSSFIFHKKDDKSKPISRIAVASGCRCCGVSFVCAFLANGLKPHGSVSISEPGRPYFYTAMDLEKHFLYRGFEHSYEKLRAGEKLSFSNTYNGINWIVRMPEDYKKLSSAELFRSFYMTNCDYNIIDCSGLSNDESLGIMAESDYSVSVVDPLPSRLLESLQFIENSRLCLKNNTLLVNKLNDGIYTNELNRFLGTKSYFSIASVPAVYIYKSEYAGKFVMELDKVSSQLKETQDMLLGLFNIH